MQIQISSVKVDDVGAVAALHHLVLGTTLNAQLGAAHLRRLYRGLLVSTHGIVLCARDVATAAAPIIGFVSGTDDADALQSDLIRTPGTRILLSLAWGLLQHPWLVGKLIVQWRINRPVIYQQQVVTASLLTMGVHPMISRRGVGRQLVHTLMAELRQRGVKHFHLNTKNQNTGAREFYRALGGQLWRSWQGNDIYLFVLDQQREP
jgi:ribosomal protein S18 acetylase RimI-like enzyme